MGRALKTTSAHAEASPAAAQAVERGWLARLWAFLKGAVSDQALRWPLLLPLALAGGAALYMSAPFEPDWRIVTAITAPAVLLWLLLQRRGGGLLALAFGMIACAGFGVGAGIVRSALVSAPVLRQETGGPVRIEGVIAEIDAGQSSRRLRIHVRAIEGLTPDQTPKFVRFSFKGDMPYSPGRAVACQAILSPPPRPVVPGDYAFHRDAYFAQLGAVGFAVGQCEPLPTPPPSTLASKVGYWIGAVRRALSLHVYEEAGEKGGGMSAAMVAGDRSLITPDDAEALRLSGLAHLLSISGVHMVLAGGIVFFLIRMLWPLVEPLALRIPTPRAAAFGAIVACALYFAISGAEVATQRSYVMAIIGFGAKLFDRPAISLRSLAVSLVIVVLLQPESVVTPGFQMSFAASGALIALYEMWPKLDKPIRPGVFARAWAWVVGATATSLVASLATMPFALYHFDRAALFSVVANIVSTPVITLWTTPAAAAAALAAPLGQEGPFLWLLGKSIEVVLAIAHYSADMSPPVDLPRLGEAGLALAAAAIALGCVLTRRGRAFAAIPAAAALVIWITGPDPVGYVADDGTVFLKARQGWVQVIDWRGRNGLDPLIIGDDVRKSGCPSDAKGVAKGQACGLEMAGGRFEILPGPGEPEDGCPAAASLVFTPRQGLPLTLDPCAYAGKGGAVIETSWKGEASLRAAQMQSGRAWTQPLYPRPPRPKVSKPKDEIQDQ
ncbi:MAG TPA: ComEC/Rec2 family competence protein [Hyphomonadaceae bacterium]|nr:ComEC/Rec2 family competence protein [Hyphomonadaceae bacterium]